jgi:ABC-type arginine/histidine transport system permease subunit
MKRKIKKMSTNTKKSVFKGAIEALKQLGNTEGTTHGSNIQLVVLPSALVEALDKIDKGRIMQEVTTPLNVTTTKNEPPNVRKTYEARVKGVNPTELGEKNPQIYGGNEIGK